MQSISTIWVDALDFAQKGGWKEDTQYVHLMGSGYLIAADEPGVPVEDATVTVDVPEDGMYRIWARTRNWLRWHSPGQFTLLVDGQDFGNVLGRQPSDAWVWEIAGDVQLEKGTHTLSLHDLTGYFGRCASLLLTTDMDYVPSREIARIHKERARIKGLSQDVVDGGEYDVIVVGGGPGGVPSAIAAARNGARTLLIQNRPMLGGNGSSEIGIPFDGASVAHSHARESGIAEEIRRLRDRDPEAVGDWTRALETLAAAEENLTVMCNLHVDGAEMESDTVIREVRALNIRTLERFKFRGRVFIDCTGDAWLGYYAGAKFRMGREAKHQTNEEFAVDVADTLTMSGSIKSGNVEFFYKTDHEVPYEAPVWVPRLGETDEEFGRVIREPRMYWWMEVPNDYDDMYDGEEARDGLLLVILGCYHHMKNHWSNREKIKYHKLRFVSVMNGRRESRRLMGDYVMNQDDCTSGRMFDDAISYSGWALDIHHPMGIYSGKLGPLYCDRGVNLPKVPFRCLYSKNIDNLLMAGRNVSATHVAIGTLRVQNTIAAMGQAAGTAAAMCVKLDETPRGIYQNHIHALQQQLLKDDQYIPNLKNEDEGDPCRTATAEASSTSTQEIYRKAHGNIGPLVPMDVTRCRVAGFNRKFGDINGIWLKLHNATDKSLTVTAHACTEGDLDTVGRSGQVTTGQAQVPPGENWVEFPLFIPMNSDNPGGYLRVWVDACENLSWRSVVTLSFYNHVGVLNEKGQWEITTQKNYCISMKKPVDIYADCSPESVINGYNRVLEKDVYAWVSDPEQALPQWLALTFEKPALIDHVSLVLDTDMTNPGTTREKIPAVSYCAKDYTVEVYDGQAWHTVAEVTGNFMRKRTHKFPATTVEQVRVTVQATWGDKSARIIEVRAGLNN